MDFKSALRPDHSLPDHSLWSGNVDDDEDRGELESESDFDAEDVEGDSGERGEGCDGEPLTLYLKEIRAVQLLSQQEEVEIAKRREEGEIETAESILSTPLAVYYVLDLGEKITSNELRLSDVVDAPRREHEPGDAHERAASEAKQRQAYLKSIGCLGRLAANLETLRRKLHREKNSRQQRLRAERLLAQRQRKIVAVLRALRLARLHRAAIAGSLKHAFQRLRACEQRLQGCAAGAEREQALMQMEHIRQPPV